MHASLDNLLDLHDIYLPDVLGTLSALHLWLLDSGDADGAARVLSARDVVLALHNN
jgi:hypothetical protein